MRVKQSSARLAVGGATLDLHYRVAGAGPPLFLLHPSPLSSSFMVPLMRRLGQRVTAIAPDTPGFGESQPLHSRQGEVADLAPFVEAMIALREAMGLKQVAVYGSATGAQIAIEWAKADAGAVCGVILDNAASFTAAERERIMDGYFPDLTPTADGGYLARAWQAAHDGTLFFPWQSPEHARRLGTRFGPVAAIDATAKGYLAAGPCYQVAYRAAFRNERAERAQSVRAPMVVLRWQGSILKPWSDRFDDYGWGDNVVMAHCGPTVEERWACLESHLGRVLPAEATAANDLRLDTGPIRYVGSDSGQVCYRLPPDSEPAGIALHAPGGSGILVELASSDLDWACVDLPGHGGSAKPGELSVERCIEAVRRVMDVLEAPKLAICGQGASKRIAECLARADARLEYAPVSVSWFEGALPELDAEASGAHLWRGWSWLRRDFLERDGQAPEPARLTRMLLALLDSQAAYRALHPLLGNG